MQERRTNRLAREKSPYLLQHAYNPVDWYPWSEEAFARAAEEDKPVFLSIGYSTCHWCHVMEKESFEDEAVARLMNDAFISIKVDREERPDLDHVYMTVCNMMTGSGGWPLTIVMTPEKAPFFAATYIPKENRFGRVGLLELIPRIREVWQTRRAEVMASVGKITAALNGVDAGTAGGDLGTALIEKGYREIARRFDAAHGGFGPAPKFPTPHQLLFLLRWWKRSGDAAALEMVQKTLRAMCLGGIFDQIGYGFHRYSTDAEWLVPHFEKMLYDQALLALAYLEAFQATGVALYAETAREIFAYVLRDMRSPEGAFYSAEDADSEGVEGKFYVWSAAELRSLLGDEDAALAMECFNAKPEGNFQEEATGRRTGGNILHLREPLEAKAGRRGLSPQTLADRLARIRERLFAAREKRIRPHRDDKVLTDWNGLMAAALARGAMVLGEPDYASAAAAALRFILESMGGADGALLHRYREGEGGIGAFVDDYAFLVWGLIECYEATFDEKWLRSALALNDRMLEDFWDRERGGLFFTPEKGEALIVRKKEIYDGAVPSGNAVAMLNLLRLSHLTGRSALEERAAELARAFSSRIGDMPSAYTFFLMAADFAAGPVSEVVLVGRREDPDLLALRRELAARFHPNRVTLFRPGDEDRPEIDALTGFTSGYRMRDGKATAYVCRSQACMAPTTEAREMLSMLE